MVVVPYWPSRPWFPQLGILLIEKPAQMPPRWNLLKMHEDPNMEHLPKKNHNYLFARYQEQAREQNTFAVSSCSGLLVTESWNS